MTNRLLTSLILSLSLTYPSIGYTFPPSYSYCQNNVHVFFGNGVFNDAEEAEIGKEILKERVDKKVRGTALEDKIKYGLAYNPSDGKIADLMEAYLQKTQSGTSQFWRFLANLVSPPDYFRSNLIEITQILVDHKVLNDNPAVQEHIKKYNTLLGEGDKVVIVAHSQGNLFANLAYLGIKPEHKVGFGIVSIANPDSEIADGGPYTTIEEDWVIKAVPLSLPANTDNFFGYVHWNDTSGHYFIDSYMKHKYAAEIQILNDIQNRINTLHFPTTTLSKGLLTATLTWGYNRDLDLHVYEPDGTHVYYRNKTGTSGYIDRDDVDGYGPEHYFVSCDTIHTGKYMFGVNYYSGSSVEFADISLRAGDQYLGSHIKSFSYPKGTSGDSNPTIMFEVEVKESQVTGYEFEVNKIY